MVLVVGYDHHPHVVHVVDDADDVGIAPASSADRGAEDLDPERQHIEDALVDVQWTYRRLQGDPATALLETTNQRGASMLIVGRPEHGIGAAVGHIITGNVTRNLLRRSNRPVVIVPKFGVAAQ